MTVGSLVVLNRRAVIVFVELIARYERQGVFAVFRLATEEPSGVIVRDGVMQLDEADLANMDVHIMGTITAKL